MSDPTPEEIERLRTTPLNELLEEFRELHRDTDRMLGMEGLPEEAREATWPLRRQAILDRAQRQQDELDRQAREERGER